MTRELFPSFAPYLRQLTTTAAADGKLLADFLTHGDDEAFTALVQRHGPMVWSLCRRILRDASAAEDVFQGTFLLLAERAGAIRRPASLASWLHGVAYRLSVRAKPKSARVQAGDVSTAPGRSAEPAEELAARELFGALDQELLHLHERYRLPLVLCYLEGRTRDEAARELGWSVGTLRRRLEQGRELLHARLKRRGLTLPAVLTGLLASDAAAVPARLRAAVLATTRSSVPATVVSLAHSASGATIGASAKQLAALGACLAVLGIGFGALAPAGPDPARPAEPKPFSAALAGADAARVQETLRLAETAVVACAPNNLPMLRELAILQARSGDARASLVTFRRVADRLARPEGHQRVFPLISLAWSLAEAGDRVSAQTMLEEALKLAPTIPVLNNRDDLVRFAVVVMAEKVDCAKALEHLSLIPSENSRFNALKDIATQQAKAGVVAGALQSVDKMRAAPGYFKFEPWQAIATAQLKAGDRSGAEATLRQALDAAEEMRLKQIGGRMGWFVKQVEILCRYAVGQSFGGDQAGARATMARVDRLIGPGKRTEHAQCLATLARAQAEAGERRAAEETLRRLRKLALESFDIADYSNEDVVRTRVALEDWDAAATAARLGSADLLRQVSEAQAQAGQADAALARAGAAKSAEDKAWELLGVVRGLCNRIPADRLPRHDGKLSVQIPATSSQPPPSVASTKAEPIFEYQQIVGEYERAWQNLNERLEKVKAEDRRRLLLEQERPNENDYAKRFLELARKHPGELAAFRSLAWIGEFANNTPTAETALELLRQDYLADRSIGDVCMLAMASRHQVEVERLIREVLAKSPHRMARGQACLSLADFLKLKADRARHLQRPPSTADARRMEEFYGPAVVRDLKSADPAKLVAEAETLYERVLDEFAELQPDRTFEPLAARARAALNEIRLLAIGKTAPEISGEDTDGKPLKLSDYRGKVVVLSFWATWCGPCRAQIPGERELVKRLDGRPFVLLGVNGDDDREKLRKFLAKDVLPWRSWWDHRDNEEKGQGGIARDWNVNAWPTVYVLDFRGVIRYRNVFDRDLDAAVDGLLKEMDGR
jgi:RNA polymerase sigma factor (sigma-70 family)